MKKYFKILIVTILIVAMLTINVCGSNWYQTSYSWARNNGLVGTKSNEQLLQNVDSIEFYEILFNYFEKNSMMIYYLYQKQDSYSNDNYALVGTERKLTALAEKEWITNSEYKTAKNLIEKAYELMNRNKKHFTENEAKSINYYLEVINYILYTKIYDYDFKLTQSVKKPINGDMFVKYHLIPFYGEVTREEFLYLMYRYKQDPEETNLAKIIKEYKDSGVLLGYDNNLMLGVNLTNAHMLTFLSRM